VASAFSGRIEPLGGDAVSAAPAAFVTGAFRWGGSHAPWYETVAIGFAIVLMAVACVLIFRHLRRRERQPKQVADQWQALAVMGELCPHGWQAQITLYGWGAPMPADAPPSRTPLVELEWKQFEEESERVVVARRVWAPTIGGALQTMVEDRRTDMTLEQIEREADEDGDVWWSE
jgi:hypothetical protein